MTKLICKKYYAFLLQNQRRHGLFKDYNWHKNIHKLYNNVLFGLRIFISFSVFFLLNYTNKKKYTKLSVFCQMYFQINLFYWLLLKWIMPQMFLYDIHPYMNNTFIQKFGVFACFLKTLLLTKAAFIWSWIQYKQ